MNGFGIRYSELLGDWTDIRIYPGFRDVVFVFFPPFFSWCYGFAGTGSQPHSKLYNYKLDTITIIINFPIFIDIISFENLKKHTTTYIRWNALMIIGMEPTVTSS